MNKKHIAIAVISIIGVTTAIDSCAAIAGTSVGTGIIKNMLLRGINKGLGIFSDKQAFLTNNLIDQALPEELKNINSTLVKLGLSNIVKKEKEIIAETAFYTVDTARPILINAVNNLTPEEAVRIAKGGKSAAIEVLREKTQGQLITAFAPKVSEKLNEYGVFKTMNTAMSGSNLLGSILGQNNSQPIDNERLSDFATQQLVNGLFKIIQKDVEDNSQIIGQTTN